MKKLFAMFSGLSMLFFFLPSQASAAITYATWDLANKGANVTLSGGNLIATKNNDAWQSVRSTIGKSSGKWYWEMTLANGFLDSGSPIVGIGNGSGSVSNDYTVDTNGWGATNDTGSSGGAIKKRTNNANASYAANAFGNSTIGVYYDAGAGNLGFVAADGTDLGNAYTGLAAGTYYAYAANYSDTSSWTANFGASAFTHSVPSGYNAGLYTGTVDGTGITHKLAKFTATSTIGDSLFSDDGSNTTLTAGDLFLQKIGALIDTLTNNTLNFGTTNATTMTFGRSGQNAIFNSNIGIGTTSPLSLFSIGTAGNAFRVDTTGTVKEGVWNGTRIGVANGGTGASTLTGLLQGNGTSSITGVTGTIGQIPYYNATNTLIATSTISISTGSHVSMGTTTATEMLNLGNDDGKTNSTTTIRMGKIQFDGYNSAGVRTCMFIQGTTIKAVAGACK